MAIGGGARRRGGGVRGVRGRGGNVGGKRKADGYSQPDSKRRQINNNNYNSNQNWGSQPIAQQPLHGADSYGYKSDQEFYQDSFGHQWK